VGRIRGLDAKEESERALDSAEEIGCGLDSMGSEWDPVAGLCEHSNEPSGSIKGDFLTT
jgi:hypothetical protein